MKSFGNGNYSLERENIIFEDPEEESPDKS